MIPLSGTDVDRWEVHLMEMSLSFRIGKYIGLATQQRVKGKGKFDIGLAEIVEIED